VAGSVMVSMKPPPVPNVTGDPTVAPSGSRSVYAAIQHPGLTLTLTRCPIVPAKISLAF
jgi:hypothetical protein